MLDKSMAPAAPTAVDLSIVIPCRNEAARLAQSLKDLESFFKGFPLRWEVEFVVSKGQDQTANLLTESAQKQVRFHVHSLHKNKGKGYALNYGLKKAAGRYVATMDMDLEVPLSEILRFLSLLESNEKLDAVIADRFHKESLTLVPQLKKRAWATSTYLEITHLLELTPGFDCQAPFKIYRRESLNKILPQTKLSSRAFETEILALALSEGLHVLSQPVRWTYDTRSSFSAIRELPSMLWDSIVLGARIQKPAGKSN
jgi:dolichyl-phosphate beta-glucosyltransferase